MSDILCPQGTPDCHSAFHKVCVTNRALCKEDFLVRIEKIVKVSPAGIILREKDLSEKEYRVLAEQVIAICHKYQVPCILHSFIDVAIALNARAIHLPLPILRELSQSHEINCRKPSGSREASSIGGALNSLKQARFTGNEMEEYKWQTKFDQIGASCHSVEDAVEAEKLGCTYITAGHIFATDCKKGVSPRGIEFLKTVCETVNIPVYAIGGINEENMDSVRSAGAKGACIMSGLMCCEDVEEYMEKFRNKDRGSIDETISVFE